MKIKKLHVAIAFLYTFCQFSYTSIVFAGQIDTASAVESLVETDLESVATASAPTTYTPQIQSPAAILIDADTGIIIYERNMHEQKYPASITKLMTALMLLEYIDGDFDERIFMSRDAVFGIPRGSSHIAMNEYETLSAEESLYAIMLRSANEVSNAIAEHVARDWDTFATMMTIRAHELGATNTSFMNAHGLHDDNHYTTAYDMALIMQELIKHERFVEIINTRMFTIGPTERQPSDRVLYNTNRMIHPGNFFHEYIVGGKTGFTNEAAHTLVSYARNEEGLGLITVTLQNQRLMTFADTELLVDYGFTMFDDVEIFNKEDFEYSARVVQVDADGEYLELGYVPLVAEHSVTKHVPTTVSLSDIDLEIDIPEYLTAPALENQVVGQVLIKHNNIVLDTVNLLATDNILPMLITEELPAIGDIYSGGGGVPFPLAMMTRTVTTILGLFLAFKILQIRYQRRLKRRRIFENRRSVRGSRGSSAYPRGNYRYKHGIKD